MKPVIAATLTFTTLASALAGCAGNAKDNETTATTSSKTASSTSSEAPSSNTSPTSASDAPSEIAKSTTPQDSATSAKTKSSSATKSSTKTSTARKTGQQTTADSSTPQVYRLTPTTIAGLKLPIKEQQIALLSKRLGKPKTVNKAHCSFAADIGKAGKHHKWGDLILATDPFHQPKQYSYWYLTGPNVPDNIKPNFMIGINGSVETLKKTYPKIEHDVADPSFGGYLTGPGLPSWFEMDNEIIAVASADIGCLRSE